MIKIGINGFGRIGRAIFKNALLFDNIQTGKIAVLRASSHEVFLYYALLRSMIQNNDYYKILK